MKTIAKGILIGLAVATIMLIVMAAFSGCDYGQRLSRATEAFKAENPTAKVIPVDEDGDGTNDFLGVDANGDNKVDTDSTGKLVEVPGTRAEYANAQAVDQGLGELIADIGLVLGVPGVGLLGAWWGKRKPVKQLTDLVSKFESARQGTTVPDALVFSKSVLDTMKTEKPELYALVKEIRASVNKK